MSKVDSQDIALVCAALGLGLAASPAAIAQTPAIPQTEGASVMREASGTDPRATILENRIESLAEEVRSQPDNAELLATYGLSLVRFGRHDEGLNALMRATAKAPGEPRVALLYSKALIRVGSLEQAAVKALETVESPLATEEEIGEAYSVAGFARFRQGDVETAESHLRKAIEHTPRDAGANLNLGLVLYSTGRRATGISLMEKASLLAPEDPRIQRIVADLYEHMGQSEKSLLAWERVSAAYPDDLEIRLKLATGWLAFAEAERAIPHLEAAAGANERNRRVRVLLATAYADVGEFARARAQADEAERLGANVSQLRLTIDEQEAEARAPERP